MFLGLKLWPAGGSRSAEGVPSGGRVSSRFPNLGLFRLMVSGDTIPDDTENPAPVAANAAGVFILAMEQPTAGFGRCVWCKTIPSYFEGCFAMAALFLISRAITAPSVMLLQSDRGPDGKVTRQIKRPRR